MGHSERNMMPFRWRFIGVVVVTWNLLLGVDLFIRAVRLHIPLRGGPTGGPFTLLALVSASLAAGAILWSPRFRKRVLVPGWSRDEVARPVVTVMLITGLLAVHILASMFLTGHIYPR